MLQFQLELDVPQVAAGQLTESLLKQLVAKALGTMVNPDSGEPVRVAIRELSLQPRKQP